MPDSESIWRSVVSKQNLIPYEQSLLASSSCYRGDYPEFLSPQPSQKSLVTSSAELAP